MAHVSVIYFLKRIGNRLYQTYKKSNGILFQKIIFVEVQQRDHICRGSDQLHNSCNESGDYNCKGSFEDYLVQKRMIPVEGHSILRKQRKKYVTKNLQG